MGEQMSLSKRIEKSFGATLSRVLFIVAVESLIIALILVMVDVARGVKNDAKQYALQIDTQMEEKVSMINSAASAINSGSVEGYDEVLALVDSMVEQDDQVSAVYSCYDENITIMSGGWQPPEDFVVTERDWYKGAQANPDEVYISDPYVDLQSGGICITLAKATFKDGEMMGCVGMDMYMDDLVSLIQDSYNGNSYVFLTTAEGTILVHPNEEYCLKDETGVSVSDANHGRYEKLLKKDMKTKTIMDYKGGFKFTTTCTSAVTGWKLISMQTLTSAMLLMLVMVLIFVAIFFITRAIANNNVVRRTEHLFYPLESISSKMTKIADGELDVVFDEEKNSTEIENLTSSLTETIDSLGNYINQISDTVTAISNKDLTVSIDTEFKGSYIQIKDALEEIVLNLNDAFRQIRDASQRVFEYSQQLAETSENVAESATTQNLAINSVAGDMENLTRQTQQITECAMMVRSNADTTNDHLQQSAKEMQELIKAMDSIEKSSNQIVAFADEIANISDQTNLLALNASIEAARAGEAGKGFAVVASEIGALATSSAEASENISRLIMESKYAVEKGKSMVDITSTTMEKGVSDSLEAEAQIDEIVDYVKNQQISIEKINNSLKEITDVVASNASNAEENTAISQELTGCSQALMDMANSFSLRD
ncbi:MAG: methyl-accepting chemotaxis protein [Lachnospiraceae bacterium]